MNEQEFARKLAFHLSASARELDGGVAERLRAGRERALAAQRRPRGISSFFGRAAGLRFRFPSGLRPLAVSVAILAAVFIGDYWASWVRVGSLQEVDMALLIDDLPIDAYLDPEFKAWVQQETRS